MENEETYFAVLRALVASNQMTWVRSDAPARRARCRPRCAALACAGRRGHLLPRAARS